MEPHLLLVMPCQTVAFSLLLPCQWCRVEVEEESFPLPLPCPPPPQDLSFLTCIAQAFHSPTHPPTHTPTTSTHKASFVLLPLHHIMPLSRRGCQASPFLLLLPLLLLLLVLLLEQAQGYMWAGGVRRATGQALEQQQRRRITAAGGVVGGRGGLTRLQLQLDFGEDEEGGDFHNPEGIAEGR